MKRQSLPLDEQVNKIISSEVYRHSHWGIAVADSATGEILFDLNGDKLFVPASTTKLWSCAAALDAFGPDYRFVTPVYRRGDFSPDGVLDGDLILRGSGDPNLTGRTDQEGHLAFTNHDHTYADFSASELTETDPFEGIDDLARQIAGSGIRQVRDILVDDRLFEREAGEPGDNTRSSPIMVNVNVIDLIVTPGKSIGSLAAIQMRPQTAFAQVDCQVETVAAGDGSEVQVERINSRTFSVKGKIERGRRPLVKIAWIEEPEELVRTLLIERLRKLGVKVERSLFLPADREALPSIDAYEGLAVIAQHTSPPFSEVIKVILKVSHNPMANVLPQLLAMRKMQTKVQHGIRLQGEFLNRIGIEAGSVSFGSGAGGSLSDYTTPRATLKLLQAMEGHAHAAIYRNALPILGVDGTLSDAVSPDSPARGLVRAKTGTAMVENSLNGSPLMLSKALAGYMETASGRQLDVAIFLNLVPLDSLSAVMDQGKVLGRICEILVKTL